MFHALIHALAVELCHLIEISCFGRTKTVRGRTVGGNRARRKSKRGPSAPAQRQGLHDARGVSAPAPVTGAWCLHTAVWMRVFVRGSYAQVRES